MQNFTTSVTIKANSPGEANQKMQAMVKLTSQLDGKSLTALANKIPQVLADPATRSLVAGYLGLE